jgi:hypothetical protein
VAIERADCALVSAAEMGYEALSSRLSRFIGRVLIRGLVKPDNKMLADVEKKESSTVHGALNMRYACKYKKIRELNKDFYTPPLSFCAKLKHHPIHNQNVITHKATADVGPR